MRRACRELLFELTRAAHTFYRMCGFRQRGAYDTNFLCTD
jgi:hypothetical protein